MDFHGTVQNGKLHIDRYRIPTRAKHLESLEGKQIIESIKEDKPSKSNQQCRAIFGVLVPIIRERMIELGLEGICGLEPSKDDVIRVLYKFCSGVGEHGESKTLSKMYLGEAARFIDNCYSFCLKHFDLQLPTLDPRWKDLFRTK